MRTVITRKYILAALLNCMNKLLGAHVRMVYLKAELECLVLDMFLEEMKEERIDGDWRSVLRSVLSIPCCSDFIVECEFHFLFGFE